MAQDREQTPHDQDKQNDWLPPLVLDRGKIEAKLFSDEPDPWGP